MQRFTEGLRESYRLVCLLAFLVLTAVVSATAFAGAEVSAATGTDHGSAADSYATMPEPVGMGPVNGTAAKTTAQYTIGATTIRLRGRLDLVRIAASTGAITNKRRVDLGTGAVYLSRDETQTFNGRRYARIVSGPFAGWWVAAPNDAPDAVTRLAANSRVRLAAGAHYGLRFHANGKVRLRRLVSLESAQTFSASRRATFSGRSFVFVTSGPLSGRWVSERGTSLVAGAASQQTAPPTAQPTVAPTAKPSVSPTAKPSVAPTSTPRATASPRPSATAAPTATPTTAPTATPAPSPTAALAATWKSVVLVYRETDVTFTRADGSDYHLQARMSNTMHDLVLDTVDRFRRSVRDWSGGLAATSLTVVEVPHPITRLDKLSSGYWVGPRSVEADLDLYAPDGTYDSVFVIWQAKDSLGQKIPVGGWGLTLPPGAWANGAGYSSIITPSQLWWWTSSSAPEEVFIHEWMHQVVYFNRDAGRMDLDLHAGPSYGYEEENGTWKRWLSDVMQGKVRDGDKLIGVGPEMWAAGTPSSP